MRWSSSSSSSSSSLSSVSFQSYKHTIHSHLVISGYELKRKETTSQPPLNSWQRGPPLSSPLLIIHLKEEMNNNSILGTPQASSSSSRSLFIQRCWSESRHPVSDDSPQQKWEITKFFSFFSESSSRRVHKHDVVRGSSSSREWGKVKL